MTTEERDPERGAFGSADWRDYLALLFITLLVFTAALGLIYAFKKHVEIRSQETTQEVDE